MIDYSIHHADTSIRPKLLKVFTAESGETFSTVVVFENKEERELVSVEKIYEYLDSLVVYIRHCASVCTPLPLDENVPSDGWPMKGPWGEVEWAKMELFNWWEDAYYRDEASVPEEPEE